MKRLFSIIIIAALMTASVFASAEQGGFDNSVDAEQGGFDNFTYTENYIPGQFRDVRDTDWYAPYVRDAYNFGFMRGKSNEAFVPGGQMTLGEAVTLAARLRSIYYTGSADFKESVPYYAVYAEYALLHGMIDGRGNYEAPIRRAGFAELMNKALPPEAFTPINEIPDFGISDVASDSAAGKAVYTLYRAGILSGSDRFGTFFAGSHLTRAEACAVMVRLAFPPARVRTLLPDFLPVEVIFRRSADAVFMIETFNSKGGSIRTGSGFFISGDGLAVTNLHVIENAASATVTLSSGDTYPIAGVRAISEEFNLILFSIASDRNDWSFLTLADSDLVETGATVYALGSPRSLFNTISEGIISHSRRETGWETFIQFTAPISFGSGGSPVLNTLGQVVGVASSSYTYGQNLNLAVPINFVKEMEPGNLIKLEDLLGG